jgi:hypothetical protein
MFRWEKDLVQAFKLTSNNFISGVLRNPPENPFLLEEFDSTYGIADLVIGNYNKKPEAGRLPIDVNWVAPLRTWGDGDIVTTCDFKEKYCVSGSTASRKMHEYVDAEFWQPVSRGTYIAIKRYELFTDFVIAIEAKLKDWRRALLQARCYRKYANLSFVLLDEVYANPAIKALDMFRHAQVGLITMSSDNLEYQIHWSPDYQDVKENFHYLRLNETLYHDYVTTSV